jgi:hypothetical protein
MRIAHFTVPLQYLVDLGLGEGSVGAEHTSVQNFCGPRFPGNSSSSESSGLWALPGRSFAATGLP